MKAYPELLGQRRYKVLVIAGLLALLASSAVWAVTARVTATATRPPVVTPVRPPTLSPVIP